MDAPSFSALVPAFAELSPQELDELFALARRCTFAPHETLFEQGAATTGMYLVEEGRVAISARVLGEAEVELDTVGPGEAIGELALVDAGTRSASARALEPTVAWFIPQRHFDFLRAAFRPVAAKIMRRLIAVLCARVRARYDEIAELQPRIAPLKRPAGTSAPVGRSVGMPPPALLNALPALRRFERSEVAELVEQAHVFEAKAGQWQWMEGADPRTCLITVRGALQLVVTRGGGREPVATLGPGRIVGYLEIIDRGPRAAACCAREDSLLLEIDSATFASLHEGTSPIAMKFLDAMLIASVDAARGATKQLVRLTAERRSNRHAVFPRPLSLRLPPL